MIHYTIQGEGDPLVLIHGFPNDSTAWNPILPELVKRYKVILPDLPGAGKSAPSTEPLTMQMMAMEIKAVLDKEGIEKAVFAGHSMGGYTALECASIFPERFLGVSLVHSLASADAAEKKELRRKSIALMVKGPAEQEMFLRGMSQNLFAAEFARENPDKVADVVANGMKCSADVLANFYNAILLRSDKVEMLQTLPFPIQWIVGDEDNATPQKDALQQCHLAKINSVHLYKSCGHMSFVEKPARLTSDLIGFMDLCY